MSGAYLSVNLHKQVLFELVLVSVLYFAFCPLGPSRIILLGCILVLQMGVKLLKHIVTFFVTVNNFYLLRWRAEAIEWRLVI